MGNGASDADAPDAPTTIVGAALNFAILFGLTAVGVLAGFGFDTAVQDPWRVAYAAAVPGLASALYYLAERRGLTGYVGSEGQQP